MQNAIWGAGGGQTFRLGGHLPPVPPRSYATELVYYLRLNIFINMTTSTRSKKTITDEIVDALQDPRVKDSLQLLIVPLIAEQISKIIGDKFNEMSSNMSKISDENKELKQTSDQIHRENIQLNKENSSLQRQVNEILTYSRRDDLIIHGIAVQSFAETASSQGARSRDDDVQIGSSSEATENVVLNFCINTLGINVEPQDISVAHRLKSTVNSNTNQSASRLPPPIIVKFTRRKIRDAIYMARKRLKGSSTRIFINEHLTPANGLIHKRARDLVKQKRLSATFTSNGIVNIISNDLNSRPMKIYNLSDLPA